MTERYPGEELNWKQRYAAIGRELLRGLAISGSGFTGTPLPPELLEEAALDRTVAAEIPDIDQIEAFANQNQ